jgi:hypothetical protein
MHDTQNRSTFLVPLFGPRLGIELVEKHRDLQINLLNDVTSYRINASQLDQIVMSWSVRDRRTALPLTSDRYHEE